MSLENLSSVNLAEFRDAFGREFKHFKASAREKFGAKDSVNLRWRQHNFSQIWQAIYIARNLVSY